MTDSGMTIQVNGQSRKIDAGASIARLLGDLGVTQPHVAVELNLEVVPRAAWRHVASRG